MHEPLSPPVYPLESTELDEKAAAAYPKSAPDNKALKSPSPGAIFPTSWLSWSWPSFAAGLILGVGLSFPRRARGGIRFAE